MAVERCMSQVPRSASGRGRASCPPTSALASFPPVFPPSSSKYLAGATPLGILGFGNRSQEARGIFYCQPTTLLLLSHELGVWERDGIPRRLKKLVNISYIFSLQIFFKNGKTSKHDQSIIFLSYLNIYYYTIMYIQEFFCVILKNVF